MSLKIIPFIYNDYDDLEANTYVVIDSKSQCVVIDPSKRYDGILNYIKKNDLLLKAVLLTHAHYDHMRGIDILIDAFNCPLYVGWLDENGIKDSSLNLKDLCGGGPDIKSSSKTLVDNEILNILDEPIKVIAVPFHTIGSLAYYLEGSKAVFTGDCLFKMSVGRSDFANSDRKSFKSTIAKLMALNDEIKVFPGHGVFTTIGDERKLNPFIK